MTIKRAIERIEATRELADTDGQPSKSYVLGQALRILKEEDDTKAEPCQCEKCKNGRAKSLMDNAPVASPYFAEDGEWEKQDKRRHDIRNIVECMGDTERTHIDLRISDQRRVRVNISVEEVSANPGYYLKDGKWVRNRRNSE